jgi:hypothetical protein
VKVLNPAAAASHTNRKESTQPICAANAGDPEKAVDDARNTTAATRSDATGPHYYAGARRKREREMTTLRARWEL